LGNFSSEEQENLEELGIDGAIALAKQLSLVLEFLYMQNHEYMEDFKWVQIERFILLENL
jgi:hypothetical protein